MTWQNCCWVLRKISEDMKLFFCQIISRPQRQHVPNEATEALPIIYKNGLCVHMRSLSQAHLNDKEWDIGMFIFKVYPRTGQNVLGHLYMLFTPCISLQSHQDLLHMVLLWPRTFILEVEDSTELSLFSHFHFTILLWQ